MNIRGALRLVMYIAALGGVAMFSVACSSSDTVAVSTTKSLVSGDTASNPLAAVLPGFALPSTWEMVSLEKGGSSATAVYQVDDARSAADVVGSSLVSAGFHEDESVAAEDASSVQRTWASSDTHVTIAGDFGGTLDYLALVIDVITVPGSR